MSNTERRARTLRAIASEWAFAWTAVIVVTMVFDFRFSPKLRGFVLSGVASYLVPYDISSPGTGLLEDLFLQQIRSFPDRDNASTFVLLGNSVVAGIGSHERQFLNRQLSLKHNVINAGIVGEYLGASAALAMVGMKTALQAAKSSTFDVFLVYNPFRIYTDRAWAYKETYRLFCNARYGISNSVVCKDHAASAAVENPLWLDGRAAVERFFLGNMRCLLTPAIVTRFLSAKQVWCEELFAPREKRRSYAASDAQKNQWDDSIRHAEIQPFLAEESLGRYLARVEPLLQKENDGKHAYHEMISKLYAPDQRLDHVDTVSRYGRAVEQVAADHGGRARLHFVLLSDPDALASHLTREQAEKLFLGRRLFLEDLRAKNPEWDLSNVAPFVDDAYLDDGGHLVEAGAIQLAVLLNALSERSKQ